MLGKLISKVRDAKSAPNSTTDHNIILDAGNRIRLIEGISSYPPLLTLPKTFCDNKGKLPVHDSVSLLVIPNSQGGYHL